LFADIETFSAFAAKLIAYARDYRAERPTARPNDCIEMAAWRRGGLSGNKGTTSLISRISPS
jgi:hypothetical protein